MSPPPLECHQPEHFADGCAHTDPPGRSLGRLATAAVLTAARADSPHTPLCLQPRRQGHATHPLATLEAPLIAPMVQASGAALPEGRVAAEASAPGWWAISTRPTASEPSGDVLPHQPRHQPDGPPRRPRAPTTIAISLAGRLRAGSLRSQNSTLDAPPPVVRRRLTPDTALRLLRTARKSVWTASRCKAKRRRREGLMGGQREHARHGGRTHLTPPHHRHLGCSWPQPAHSTRRTGQRSV